MINNYNNNNNNNNNSNKNNNNLEMILQTAAENWFELVLSLHFAQKRQNSL